MQKYKVLSQKFWLKVSKNQQSPAQKKKLLITDIKGYTSVSLHLVHCGILTHKQTLKTIHHEKFKLSS